MKDGIILIDKPAGLSSAAVVARVKRMLGADRVGHAGTLDPEATGLLIILINGATRVASYAADGFKVYSGKIQLGVTTSTDDLAGETLATCEVKCRWSDVCEAALALTGRIQQIPPKVSAKKLGGTRAYRLHMQGHEFELAPRSVEVRRFDLQRCPTGSEVIDYQVEVSPGTYVRALARDLGTALGCGAAVASIRREASGRFRVEDACELTAASWQLVRDWGELVPELPRLDVGEDVANSLLQGQPSALTRAWALWENRTVEGPVSHVLYRIQGTTQSLGILKVVDQERFVFELNIGRTTNRKGDQCQG